ncbi:MAG: CopG family antitoxin [Syntrophales bacterium]|nr:CopG family antitoxin [Syntrophales bacterium]
MKTPKFKNIKDEREFWDTNDSTDYLTDFEETGNIIFTRPKKEVISLRIESKISNKLKEIAHQEGLPPTTFARMLIIKGLRERLDAHAKR